MTKNLIFILLQSALLTSCTFGQNIRGINDKTEASCEMPKPSYFIKLGESYDSNLSKSYQDSLWFGYQNPLVTNFFNNAGLDFKRIENHQKFSETIIRHKDLLIYLKQDSLGQLGFITIYDSVNCVFQELHVPSGDIFYCDYMNGTPCYLKEYDQSEIDETICTPISKTQYSKDELTRLPIYMYERNVVPIRSISHFKSKYTGKDTSVVQMEFNIEEYLKQK